MSDETTPTSGGQREPKPLYVVLGPQRTALEWALENGVDPRFVLSEHSADTHLRGHVGPIVVIAVGLPPVNPFRRGDLLRTIERLNKLDAIRRGES